MLTESIPSLLDCLGFIPLFYAGLLLPGMMLCRLCGRRPSLVWGFVLSAPVLLNLILLCDALGYPLVLHTVLAALLIFSGLVELVFRYLPAKVSVRGRAAYGPALGQASAWDILRDKANWTWFFALAVASGFLMLKLVLFPLSGWDHTFRWNFLAEQMLRFQTLSFYPVHKASDYAHYLWCDGIPPMVSVQQWWTYVSFGVADSWVSTPRVVLECLVLVLATGKLAAKLGGEPARLPAMVLLGCSAVGLWTMGIGQETVLTALGMVALLLALEDGELREPWRFIFAGLAAGLGALSREYGLAWIFFGLAVLVFRGEFRRGWAWFLLAVFCACGPWYLRNWFFTGNPLFPHGLGGLFPGNEVHDETMRIIRSYCMPLHDPVKFCKDLWVSAPGYIAPPLIALGSLIVCRKLWRSWVPVLSGALLVTALWLLSVSETAGGWGYSFRVLMPMTALASVLGGLGIALLAGRARLLSSFLFLVLVSISGLRSLYLPTLHEPSWDDLFSSRWIRRERAFDGLFINAEWKAFLKENRQGIILVDEPTCQAGLIKQGAACTLSLFSPEVRFLFDEKLGLSEQLSLLRSLQIRYLVLSPGNTISEKRADLHPFFHVIQRKCQPVKQISFNAVYDIDALLASLGRP